MTDSSSSNSLLLREKGNVLYRELQGECVFAPVVCRMKFTQAQHYDIEALSHSHTAVGRVSCLKIWEFCTSCRQNPRQNSILSTNSG